MDGWMDSIRQITQFVKPKNRPGPARLGHVKIALDITAVDVDHFFSLQYRYDDHIW